MKFSKEDLALSADEWKAKFGIKEGQTVVGASQPVAKTRPNLPKGTHREPTIEEKIAVQQAAINFFRSHPHIRFTEANAEGTTRPFFDWFFENDIIPTTEKAWETAFGEIAEELTYVLDGKLFTPAQLVELDSKTFKKLTSRQSVAPSADTLEDLSSEQVKEYIDTVEAEEGLKSEGTLIALVALYPAGTETGDAARQELTALRTARRNDLSKIPAIVISQRERLISTVLEQRPWLLNGFSREEVSDALLTYLEKCRQSWSLQSLNAAAELLEGWGDLPRSNSPSRAGIHIVENPQFTPPVPNRPIQVVEDKPKRYSKAQLRTLVGEMSSAELSKACAEDREFERAVNEL